MIWWMCVWLWIVHGLDAVRGLFGKEPYNEEHEEADEERGVEFDTLHEFVCGESHRILVEYFQVENGLYHDDGVDQENVDSR